MEVHKASAFNYTNLDMSLYLSLPGCVTVAGYVDLSEPQSPNLMSLPDLPNKGAELDQKKQRMSSTYIFQKLTVITTSDLLIHKYTAEELYQTLTEYCWIKQNEVQCWVTILRPISHSFQQELDTHESTEIIFLNFILK